MRTGLFSVIFVLVSTVAMASDVAYRFDHTSIIFYGDLREVGAWTTDSPGHPLPFTVDSRGFFHLPSGASVVDQQASLRAWQHRDSIFNVSCEPPIIPPRDEWGNVNRNSFGTCVISATLERAKQRDPHLDGLDDWEIKLSERSRHARLRFVGTARSSYARELFEGLAPHTLVSNGLLAAHKRYSSVDSRIIVDCVARKIFFDWCREAHATGWAGCVIDEATSIMHDGQPDLVRYECQIDLDWNLGPR